VPLTRRSQRMLELQYPIGKFSAQENYSAADIDAHIKRLAALPGNLQNAVAHWSDAQLNTPYREGGWTVRQLIHHMADSHLNAYIRLKWTLTEENPIIKAYNEKAWAETPEVAGAIHEPLTLLMAIHNKWCSVLVKLSPTDFKKTFTHPETKKQVSLQTQLALYAWHGEHHLAHITRLKERQGWS
jgi:uncharacterized damage-inducible protein DinB